MENIDGKITISKPSGHDCDYISISLYDENAGIEFCEVKIKYADFAIALTGLAHTKCKFDVRGLENVGKKEERRELIFEFPKEILYKERHSIAYKLALANCPEGWTPSSYFGSRDSFFTKDGKEYARCSIYRWV